MLAMLESIYEWESTAAAHLWFERVPSVANPSDAPSRMDFKGLPESCRQRVNILALWRDIPRPQPGDVRLE